MADRVAASKAWEDLSEDLRRLVIRDLLDRRGKRLRHLFSNVTAIGIGCQTTAGRRTGNLCLRFHVRRKWVRRDGREGEIPSEILHRCMVQGRTRVYAIPTDIEVVQGGRVDSGGIDGFMAKNLYHPLRWVRGSACCVVANAADQGELFLLGCHHVFTLSKAFGGTPRADAYVHRSDGERLGPTTYWTPLRRSDGTGLDAALCALVRAHLVDPSFPGIRPRAIAPQGHHPVLARVHSPRGSLTLKFSDEMRWAEVKIGDVATIIPRVLAYYAQTEAGDSGSPLLDSTGLLFGMHFYRHDSGLRYAIPADVLFEPGLFRARLALALA